MHLHIITLQSNIDIGKLKYLSSMLPLGLAKRMLNYKFDTDKLIFFLGKFLTMYSIHQLGLTNIKLKDLLYTRFKRPYFEADFDFNISHSGEYIVCLISNIMKVGVDIEKINTININDFSGQFTAGEFCKILAAKDKESEFYRLWTRKEAIVKADGRGMNLAFDKFDVLKDQIYLDDNIWNLQTIPLVKYYSLSIATSSLLYQTLEVNYLNINEVINNDAVILDVLK